MPYVANYRLSDNRARIRLERSVLTRAPQRFRGRVAEQVLPLSEDSTASERGSVSGAGHLGGL